MKIKKSYFMSFLGLGLIFTSCALSNSSNLFSAIEKKDINAVNESLNKLENMGTLIEKINEFNRDDLSPLMLAVYKESPEIIDLLLQKGADPNQQNKSKANAFWMSCGSVNHNLAKYFFDYNPLINEPGPKGITPLILASMAENKDLIIWLLQNGAYVNSEDNEGNTPFVVAAASKNYDIAPLFFDYNPDINHGNKYGETALFNATHKNNVKLISWLLSHDANPNIIDKETDTPIFTQLVKDNNVLMVLLFINNAKKLNINIQDSNGDTPLIWAIKKNHDKMVPILMKAGANSRSKNNNGESAFSLARALQKSHLYFLL